MESPPARRGGRGPCDRAARRDQPSTVTVTASKRRHAAGSFDAYRTLTALTPQEERARLRAPAGRSDGVSPPRLLGSGRVVIIQRYAREGGRRLAGSTTGGWSSPGPFSRWSGLRQKTPTPSRPWPPVSVEPATAD